MRTNKLRTMLVYLCVCAQLLVVGATRAQSGRGTVSGRVTDTSGGVLQGAAVELDSAGAAAERDAGARRRRREIRADSRDRAAVDERHAGRRERGVAGRRNPADQVGYDSGGSGGVR